MPTYGVHTGLQYTSVEELRSLWTLIEGLGYEWISVWDHFYAADATGNPDCLEAVALHSALACTTGRVRCGSLVYCAGYRHPAVLAKAITAIDRLSGGRADLGLGAGWSELEYRAYGIPFPAVATRMDMLEETAACVRALLHSDEPYTFSGRHFTFTEARNVPRPVQAMLPIWIGGGGERRTLRVAARYADGWNIPFVSPQEFARKRGVLHHHCGDVGRDPSEIRCAVNVGIARDDEDFAAQFGDMRAFVAPGVLMGSDDEIIDRIGEYAEVGADQVNLALRAPFNVESLERFAEVLKLT